MYFLQLGVCQFFIHRLAGLSLAKIFPRTPGLSTRPYSKKPAAADPNPGQSLLTKQLFVRLFVTNLRAV
jgi:hypothetical protein